MTNANKISSHTMQPLRSNTINTLDVIKLKPSLDEQVNVKVKSGMDFAGHCL